MELRTEASLAQGGDAIARAPDGRIVFVEGAAPLEQVRVEVIQDNRRFLRARTLEVLDASPSRVEPSCEYFDRCGGCTLQHVAPQAQVEAKHRAALQTIQKIGGEAATEATPPWATQSYGYRTRARLAVGPRGQVGYRASKSNQVLDIERCPVLDPQLQRGLEALREAVKKQPQRSRRTHEVELCTDGRAVMISLPPPLRSLQKTLQAHEVLADRAQGWRVDSPHGDVWVRPSVFSQSSLQGNEALLEWVKAQLPSSVERALELYSGSGNFTRLLAAVAKEVVAIESSAQAIALAKAQKLANVKLVCASAERALEDRRGSFELALVDPPRAGLSAGVRSALVKLAPPQLIYVSCDPATFARDMKTLKEEGGYAIERLQVLDLYPQTPHVEVVARLRASGSSRRGEGPPDP